jgi:hypothetical protein
MRFPAPWDRTLRIATTVAVVAAAAGAVALLRLAARTETPFATAMGIAVAGAIALTLALSFAGGPRGYTVEAGRLRVDRPLRAVEIPLASIRAAGALPDGALRGAARLVGSGGLFGYYGRFWSRRLGAFRLYATRRTGLVVVDTATERFVLSPEPPGRFLDVLLSRAPSATRALSGAPLPARPVPRRVKVGLAALVVVVPVVFAGIVGGVWAYSPVAAVVEAGEIRIERRLAPAVVIPLGDVRRVERLAPEHACRLWRVAGTAVPGGVRYGHFRSRELGDVQLYAWRSDAYVLLETEGARIVVTPDDPAAFLAAVRAGGPR